MANKIKVKLILELRTAHMSRNSIARTGHMSKNSVGDVFHISDRIGITFNDDKDKSKEEVYRMFYPDKYAIEYLYKDPTYGYVHSELKKVGVTLKLLWHLTTWGCGQKFGL